MGPAGFNLPPVAKTLLFAFAAICVREVCLKDSPTPKPACFRRLLDQRQQWSGPVWSLLLPDPTFEPVRLVQGTQPRSGRGRLVQIGFGGRNDRGGAELNTKFLL